VAAQTHLLWGHTLPSLAQCHRRFGDVFSVRVAPMGTLVYLADGAARGARVVVEAESAASFAL
jgi:hypothetical protein